MICIICGKNTGKILTDKLRGGKQRKVYYCPICKLGMLENKQSSKGLRQYYDKTYRKQHKPVLAKVLSPKEIFDIESPLQRYRLELIKPRLKKTMRILEVGCSAGMFLAAVKPYVKTAYGIDYDSRSARFAAAKTGFPVYTSDVETTWIPEKSLDMICMFHTLEHVQNPAELLKKLSRYLKPGGLFFIEVPNLDDALLSAYGLKNYYENHWFHEAHLWYFSPKSLSRLLKKIGFASKIHFYQDYNFLNHMHWLAADKPQATASIGRGAPRLPLRASLDRSKAQALNQFIAKANKAYKQILEQQGLAANMLLIAKKGKLS